MVAYSSAAQIGYIYMGVGISPALGMLAAVFHIFTHAVTKPMLFLACAELSDTAGGRLRHDWRGVAHRDRMAALVFSLGSFSMIGIPLTMGFVSKYRFALAAFERASLIVPTLIVLAVSTVLNTLYFARVVVGIYVTPTERRPRVIAPRAFTVSTVILMVLNLAAGVAAEPLVRLMEQGINLL